MRMGRGRLALLLMAIMLPGCKIITQEQLDARYEAVCKESGLTPETGAFQNCVFKQKVEQFNQEVWLADRH
jgi:hypothetical protein